MLNTRLAQNSLKADEKIKLGEPISSQSLSTVDCDL